MAKTVQIQLTGMDYPLVFERSLGNILLAEIKSGINLFYPSMGGDLGFRHLGALMFAALLKNHPKVTLEDATQLLERPDVFVVMKALSEVMDWSGPKLAICSRCQAELAADGSPVIVPPPSEPEPTPAAAPAEPAAAQQ